MGELDRVDVAVKDIRPHPRNYRSHPDSQIEHLMASIEQYGFFRNIVLANDGTILAGHGVVEAAKRLGHDVVPAVRLDLDPESPAALKLLAADNELARFAENDDRALTELLKQIAEDEPLGLLGTGYDEMQLANLLLVTRPAHEIEDMNEAAQWVGMPGFEAFTGEPLLMLRFDTDEDRDKLVEQLELKSIQRGKTRWSAWWPPRDQMDMASVRFDG